MRLRYVVKHCNYWWVWAFKVITELWGLYIFIVHVDWFALNGSGVKACFSKRSLPSTPCYMFIVLTCKVPFLFMSEWAYATQSTPHTEVISVWAGKCSWTGALTWHQREHQHVSGYLWKVMMILAVLLINSERDCNVQRSASDIAFDMLTQWVLKSACVRNSELIVQCLTSED